MIKRLTFSDDEIFKKNPGLQAIRTAEGIIISRSNLKDDSIYYFDNPVSSKIWTSINGKNTLKQIKRNLLSEYDVTESKLDQDLKKFLENLYQKKLISKVK